jgi:threonine/homoserine/homoserine lactone efflux protein
MLFARSVLGLTAIHVTLALTWHVVWAVAGGTMARHASGWPRRLLDAGAGAAMLALGVAMAISG